MFDHLASFENLYEAWKKASKGKRKKYEVGIFELDLERNLLRIHRELLNNSWCPSGYRIFTIHEKKPRKIAAAPFRDRVVHHALTNVLEPIFEPWFVPTLYSNRKGKGVHGAVAMAKVFAQRNKYVIHADVKSYFPSINRTILLNTITDKITCLRTYDLIARILDIRQIGLESGLPLGNQCSQFFANIHLTPIDRFMYGGAHLGGYMRYVDDMWLFGKEKETLWRAFDVLTERLKKYDMMLNQKTTTFYRVCDSFPCLGYRVYPSVVLVRREAILRFRRKAKKLAKAFTSGQISLEKIKCSLMGSMGHLGQACSSNLCHKLMNEVVLKR